MQGNMHEHPYYLHDNTTPMTIVHTTTTTRPRDSSEDTPSTRAPDEATVEKSCHANDTARPATIEDRLTAVEAAVTDLKASIARLAHPRDMAQEIYQLFAQSADQVLAQRKPIQESSADASFATLKIRQESAEAARTATQESNAEFFQRLRSDMSLEMDAYFAKLDADLAKRAAAREAQRAKTRIAEILFFYKKPGEDAPVEEVVLGHDMVRDDTEPGEDAPAEEVVLGHDVVRDDREPGEDAPAEEVVLGHTVVLDDDEPGEDAPADRPQGLVRV